MCKQPSEQQHFQFPSMLHRHLEEEQQQKQHGKIIGRIVDVDQVSAQRHGQRRRLSQKLKKMLKPFRHSHAEDLSETSKSSSSSSFVEELAVDPCPFEAAQRYQEGALSISSTLEDDEMDVDALVHTERQQLSQELLMELVLFRWPLRVNEAPKRSLSPELLREIRANKYAVQPELQKALPNELLQEIVHFSTQNLKKKEEPEVKTVQPQSSRSHKPQEANKDELVSLKERCANLSTITDLLSKQLVELTFTKKRESALKRQETKHYQKVIRQLEEQHRLECALLFSDKKHLEGRLQRTQMESVPRNLLSSPTKRDRPRRRNFMDSLQAPVEACLKSPCAPSRHSFSMASTILLQNKLMPAMLSAVARGANTNE